MMRLAPPATTAVAVVLTACSVLPVRTIQVVAPPEQGAQPFAVTIMDRSGLLIGAEVDVAGVDREHGFERQDRASNIVGRAEQVVVMWAGSSCDEEGRLAIAPVATGSVDITLERAFEACPRPGVMHRVLLTFVRPVDGRSITIHHVEPTPPAEAGG